MNRQGRYTAWGGGEARYQTTGLSRGQTRVEALPAQCRAGRAAYVSAATPPGPVTRGDHLQQRFGADRRLRPTSVSRTHAVVTPEARALKSRYSSRDTLTANRDSTIAEVIAPPSSRRALDGPAPTWPQL
jgi:hypothetical protein